MAIKFCQQVSVIEECFATTYISQLRGSSLYQIIDISNILLDWQNITQRTERFAGYNGIQLCS